MKRVHRIGVAATLATAALVLASPGAARADSTFGQHVRTCAQTMGFSGTHNPGMHQGFAGWNGMPCAM